MNENELTMKRMPITQDDFDDVAILKAGLSGLFYDRDDARHVASVIERRFGIRISMAEAIDFWCWRSNEWDSSWLNHLSNDDLIADFFEKYVRSSLNDEDDVHEDEPSTIEVVMMDEACKKWLVTMTKEFHADLQAETSSDSDLKTLIRPDHPGVLSFRTYEEEMHDGT